MKQHASYRLGTGDLHRVLARVSFFRSFAAICGDWLLILGTAVLSTAFSGSWALYLCACLIIASRQHALLVLMHEGAHGHLTDNAKWNDRITNLFCSWPFGVSMERYREHHWKHHQFTNTEQDPDWGRKVSHPHWQFPKSSLKFWRDFLPYAWGLGVREMGFAVFALGPRLRSSPAAWLFFALTIAGLWLTHSWALAFNYWIVPYLTILPLLMKVRSIAEHLALPNNMELNASRNIVGSPIEAFFFGPHQNSLHLIHHLFPQIPWFNLGVMREGLRLDKNFLESAHENRGYFLPFRNSAIRDFTEAPSDSRLNQTRSAA
ncbi:MAG: fatty acid desaturase family protein [Bdellovibrionota bacterium]